MTFRQFPNLASSGALVNGRASSAQYLSRSETPISRSLGHLSRPTTGIEVDSNAEEDSRIAVFKKLYLLNEARLATLLAKDEQKSEHEQEQRQESEAKLTETGKGLVSDSVQSSNGPDGLLAAGHSGIETTKSATQSTKRKARSIDEEDYDDDDDEEDDAKEEDKKADPGTKSTVTSAYSKGGLAPSDGSPSKLKTSRCIPLASQSTSFAMRRTSSHASAQPLSSAGRPSSRPGRLTTEDARKKLEDEKQAVEEAAKRTFHTLFYTLEHDKDAMMEQKKLDESERKVDDELSRPDVNGDAGSSHVTLSQTNLGASSLTLKNLIRRIDDQRNKVRASDSELRTLMSEVRKNRSKWASEEKVGQEELYEACDKVLSELKGQTEHSTYFLNKVNKKDAPDYHIVIKNPMDLGTMTKKLKNLSYKSKKEFVGDAMQVWANCLKYNANPDHYLRKHALAMRKETDKLVPLIPDIVIRDRAEVEAEERRQQRAADADGDDESDDEPIMASRGRKAPSKKTKKGVTDADVAPAGALNSEDGRLHGTPVKDASIMTSNDAPRSDGHQSPPPGIGTPSSTFGFSAAGNHVARHDSMDLDGNSTINGGVSVIAESLVEPAYEDAEYKTWKQVTKKDRAKVTAERNNLFKGDRLDPEAPALLRTRVSMRNWLRNKMNAAAEQDDESSTSLGEQQLAQETEIMGRETLAEGLEDEEGWNLPDYYNSMSMIPDLSSRVQWIEDSEGLVQMNESSLRQYPAGRFIAPSGHLSRKIDANVHQIQESRRLCAKIGVIKQMAVQSQIYQGQFQKKVIAPLVEQDIEPHVTTGEDEIIAPVVTRAALQRSAAKLLIHSGFEDFQPSALDALTDIASDYFLKIAKNLAHYLEAPKVPILTSIGSVSWKSRFTTEQCILHTLQENGVDPSSLETYIKDDVERLGTRVGASHERMKAYFADLLRPALNNAGADGSGAFEDDSEQFLTGDFAEELGEDFLGLKELGLGGLFGDLSMNVPLHLLQKKLYNANQAHDQDATVPNTNHVMPTPPPFEPISMDNVGLQIGLVRNFFLAKLHANNDKPLVEDEELPVKQRLPKPRLGPGGKITSPRKKIIKEPGPGKGHPRKKFKPAEPSEAVKAAELAANTVTVINGLSGDPVKKIINPKRNSMLTNDTPSRKDSTASSTELNQGTVNASFTTPGTTGKMAKGSSPSITGDGIDSSPSKMPYTHNNGMDLASLPSPESVQAH